MNKLEYDRTRRILKREELNARERELYKDPERRAAHRARAKRYQAFMSPERRAIRRERERQRRIAAMTPERREAMNAYAREWKKTHPYASLIYCHRRTARLKKCEGSFTKDEWLALVESYN